MGCMAIACSLQSFLPPWSCPVLWQCGDQVCEFSLKVTPGSEIGRREAWRTATGLNSTPSSCAERLSEVSIEGNADLKTMDTTRDIRPWAHCDTFLSYFWIFWAPLNVHLTQAKCITWSNNMLWGRNAPQSNQNKPQTKQSYKIHQPSTPQIPMK